MRNNKTRLQPCRDVQTHSSFIAGATFAFLISSIYAKHFFTLNILLN